MKVFVIFTSLLFALGAQAHVEKIKISTDQILTEEVKSLDLAPRQVMNESFTKVKVNGYYNSRVLGGPALPMKSMLLVGTPETLQINVEQKNQVVLENTKPFPAQEERVRNQEVAVSSQFHFNPSLYVPSRSNYSMNYLGSFRGTPITQVVISLAQYNPQDNTVSMATELDVESNSVTYTFQNEVFNDYLILVAEDLQDGIKDFVNWKESQGYNVIVKSLKSPEMNTDSIQKLIADYYTNSATDFVLLVGDQIPFLKASTSGSSNTPSDLRYFTMDGKDDFIPDLFGGRISGSNSIEVQKMLSKSIEFEQKTFVNSQGLNRIVGIASNEGSSPSDNEYIQSIEKAFTTTYSYENVHFYQNDKKSNPTELNRELSYGVNWLFYMGHGSGYSWPSLNKTYSVSDMNAVQNQETVKPIIIDVACMNGRVFQGYLGTSFASILTVEANGSVAYFGGTVNISWHPPAIMAQGIAQEHAKQNFNHLGESILAGQLFLAAKMNNNSDVIDNLEWYVLQGDPSLNIKQQ
jgi:hypothetical protein